MSDANEEIIIELWNSNVALDSYGEKSNILSTC